MIFEIQIFPYGEFPFIETVTIIPELMEGYDTLIEYVQEEHAPQHEWEFVNGM